MSRAQSHTPAHNPVAAFLHNLSLALTGGLAIAAILFGYGMWRSGDRFLINLSTLLLPAQPEPQVDIKTLVVQQVRGASDLTTAVFAMQAVVPTKRDRTLGGYVIGTTTLLYIAHGEVRAGVDLSQLTPADVEQVGNTMRLRLPPAKILDSKIDVNRSSVYDYDRGWLGLGPDVAPELQQVAQRQTLQTIVRTACSEGILQQAGDRARLVVGQLLATAGQPNVEIITQSPAANACQPASETSVSPVLPGQQPSL